MVKVDAELHGDWKQNKKKMHFVYFTRRSSRRVMRWRAMQPSVNCACLISSQSLRAGAPAHVIHHVEQNTARTNGASALCTASTLLLLLLLISGPGSSRPSGGETTLRLTCSTALLSCFFFFFCNCEKGDWNLCKGSVRTRSRIHE